MIIVLFGMEERNKIESSLGGNIVVGSFSLGISAKVVDCKLNANRSQTPYTKRVGLGREIRRRGDVKYKDSGITTTLMAVFR